MITEYHERTTVNRALNPKLPSQLELTSTYPETCLRHDNKNSRVYLNTVEMH